MTAPSPGKKSPRLAATSLAALGIVYGDLGTSPLYAFRECFAGRHVAPDPANLIGAASLIFWALLLNVSVKYLCFIVRLDNRGEGGILALSALIRGALRSLGGKDPRRIMMLGLAGASLIYADGMLTPAITVLSAVEGLRVCSPTIGHWTVPIAVGILLGLFSIQRFGTGKVGGLFGPVLLLWFVAIGLLGIRGIVGQPSVLWAMSPWSGISFLIREWHFALPLLAAVFLALTGAESLYADLGHFGAKPIRRWWFSVVLPALILNYLGQASLLISNPAAAKNPFFLLAPAPLFLPMTILATAAAVIASQALISGAFSLTTQAIQLGCLPRFRVKHTSTHSFGQVYVPEVNWMLATACILLVVMLKNSENLAGAYGLAISLTMTISSILFYTASRAVWGWTKTRAMLVTWLFLAMDIPFLAANSLKITHFGWFPLVVSFGVMSLMLIWVWGRGRLLKRISEEALPVEVLQRDLAKGKIQRVPGTAIYMSGKGPQVPTALLHNLKHNHVLHECVILLHVMTLDQPYAQSSEQLDFQFLGNGLNRSTLRFGFADNPMVPETLKRLLPEELAFNPNKATYFLGRETYFVGKKAGLFDRIRLFLFAAMARNASSATAYFQLPPGRVVELGAQITL